MSYTRRIALSALLLMVGATVATAQNKATFAWKAKVGKVARYTSTATLKMEAGGTKVELEIKGVEKVTFTDVVASGNITEERQTESGEITSNGQKTPIPDEETKKKETIVIRPDGALVSFKEDGSADKDSIKLNVRMFIASQPVYPGTPLGTGDKWSHDFAADDTLGTRAAHADYTLTAYERKDGIDAAKVQMDYSETGNKPIKIKGTLWVEKSSGDVISSDLDADGIPLGGEDGPTASGSVHESRTEGGPIDDTKPGAKTDSKPEPKKEKLIDDTVKDYEKLPGMFTLYRKRESGHDSIYMEIEESQLDRPLLMEITASTGDTSHVVAGDPISDTLFKFSRSGDDRILLVTPNINFRANESTPIGRALRRSFADAYLEAFKIEAKQPERKSLLIDVSDLFKGDIGQISALFQGGGLAGLFSGGGSGYSLDRDKTYVSRLKSYPENLCVETSYNFSRSGGGGLAGTIQQLLSGGVLADTRSIPFKVNYTVFALNDIGYHPRLSDPRVGYFQTDYQTFDTDTQEEPKVHYIQRWQLEKADPKAAVSPPKKPIVFWLDNAIPLEYRDAVREGLLMWNKAFLKIGIQDAVVVKQMPDNADWDHADVRYNTIRWVASPDAGYAVAQARVNPLTGQIINANITVDCNWTRYMKSQRRYEVAPSSYFTQSTTPTAQNFDPRRCEMLSADGMEQAWLGAMAIGVLAPAGVKLDEKAFVHAWLREIVCHEMGHIMGLRHNFIASTYHSLTELKNQGIVADTGISASVMDYVPWNIASLDSRGVDYFQSTIGPYDMWAIEYGYKPIDAARPEDELPTLRHIASQCNLPGHAYESDEVADGFDPDVTRYDLGRDPLVYWMRSLKLTKTLLLNLGDREPKQGESYWEFTRDFERMLGLHARAAALACHYIGGLRINRNYKGDPGESPTLAPVSGAEQRQALDLIDSYIFSADAFKLPASYYSHLTTNPHLNMIESFLGESPDFPIFDTLTGIQQSALRYVLSPDTLDRIVNNEFKVGGSQGALTLPTLFHQVGSTIWSELESKGNVGALHRQLQRAYLDTLIGMVVKNSRAPADARMLAWDQLRGLKAKIVAAHAVPHDDYTRIHLEESLMRINRALNAQQTVTQ